VAAKNKQKGQQQQQKHLLNETIHEKVSTHQKLFEIP